MSCPAPEQLAAAAAGEDPAAAAHAETCLACRRALDEQRELRALLAAAAPPQLPRALREELAAEVLARADELPLRRRSRRVVIASFAAIAAAAAVVIVLAARSSGRRTTAPALAGSRAPSAQPATPDERTPDVRTPDTRTSDKRTSDKRTSDTRTPDTRTSDTRTPDGQTAVGRRRWRLFGTFDFSKSLPGSLDGRHHATDGRLTENRTPDGRTADRAGPGPQTTDGQTSGGRTVGTGPQPDGSGPTPSTAATVVASAADAPATFTRATGAGRDVVDLVDGAITIDARNAEPVEVVSPNAASTPDGRRGGVRVVRGKVAVVARQGVLRSVTVFAGSAEITSGGRRHVIEAGTVWDAARDGAIGGEPASEAALAAFRDGWTALRAGRYTDAIAAFDRATDPVIAEDAAYWAAIAAERAGDRTDAARRLDDFLSRFPRSPRAGAARLAREKLTR